MTQSRGVNMPSLTEFLVLAALLFGIGISGVILNRKNIITLLMSIELILLAVNTNFIAFSYFLGNQIGQVFVFFVLTVAASEAAIALAILIVWYRKRETIDIQSLDALKG
jgi:NADH-quinone oxidoreductase subunit K